MLLRKIAVENVRSFLDRQVLVADGNISIIIGPNGGGKTNLLDSIVIMIRRYLFGAYHVGEATNQNGDPIWKFNTQHGQHDQLRFEKHSRARDLAQRVEIEIEVSASDLVSMATIQREASELKAASKRRIEGYDPWAGIENWQPDQMKAGMHITYIWEDGHLISPSEPFAQWFLKFLQTTEIDNYMRSRQGKAHLQMPIIYLPVNRTAHGFQPEITLGNFNYIDQRLSADASFSRAPANFIQLAIGDLASRWRLLIEDSNLDAKTAFLEDERVKALTSDLRRLGYDWKLETVNALNNSYNVRLSKQGTSFSVTEASSGERELLTYLFAIHALNVRDALILVDEPELHLHPRWQAALLNLFERLSTETGNQFVMATHSPTFVSPSSIQYVSRVYSEDQKSRIVRLDSTALPDAKHLFNAVNSQNNERIFFADSVLLVEGVSDRIFFERVLDLKGRRDVEKGDRTLEVVSVGGKGMFAAYRKLLDACEVSSIIIADLDYVRQIGTDEIRKLLTMNVEEIKKRVINDPTSVDAQALVDRIERAIETGNWGDAASTWEYIKSRRTKLKPSLTAEETNLLETFLATKRQEGVCILSRGDLEDYLPAGYLGKDIAKLIKLVNADDFWDQIPAEVKAEIDLIAERVLRTVGM